MKLSELKDKDYIIVNGDNMLTKEDILEDSEYYKDKEMYAAKKEYIGIDVRNMLECEFEHIEDSGDSYEGWYDDICEEITDQDIEDIEKVIHRILNRDPKKSYCFREDEKIEFDIEVS